MKIECTYLPPDGGAPSPANVAGTEYAFQRDATGRFVADVFNPQHIRCLLAVEHYREAAPAEPSAGALDLASAPVAGEQHAKESDAQAAPAEPSADKARAKRQAKE